MTRLQPQSRQIMKTLGLTLAICACIALASGSASAQLASNQTNGFGNNQLVTFTYLQNFDCVDQPKLDLDFNGILAQSDPNEMQTPICQPVTEPTQDPTGGSIKHTDHVVDNSRVNTTPIWWEVRPVLILHQSDWPAADGSSGITSSKAMDDAEAAGRAIEVGSNFFLFFSSKLDSMSGMTSK